MEGGTFDGEDLLVCDEELGVVGVSPSIGSVLVNSGRWAEREEIWDALDVVWVPVGEEDSGDIARLRC